MLWRVRTTLADRPGTLARLAAHCGRHDVNILGLQIFPGVGGVTDELVLRAPRGWGLADVGALVEAAGGRHVSTVECSEHALVDAPTRHLAAVQQVLHGEPFGRVLARLLDGEPGSEAPRPGTVQHVLSVTLHGHRVEVRRTAGFTATEHARAEAFAATVEALAADRPEPPEPLPAAAVPGQVVVRSADAADVDAVRAMHTRCSTETLRRAYGTPLSRLDARLARRLLAGGAGALVAVVGGHVVGLASLEAAQDGCARLTLLVEDAHQGRGTGTRLLGNAARLAASSDIDEVVLRGPADAPATVATVFSSGLRARVRLVGDELVVLVSTRGLAPLPVPETPLAVPG